MEKVLEVYKRPYHEKYPVVCMDESFEQKAIINTPINMEVDIENQLLIITLYPLANQRGNEAVSNICDKVNTTNTVYPGTNLKLFFKIATS